MAALLAPQGVGDASALVILEPSGKDVGAGGAGTPAAAEALADLANTVPAAAATFLDTGGTYDDLWDFVLRSAVPTGPAGDPARVTLANLVNDNRADFELMARARMGSVGDLYHPVLAEPADWLSEQGWTSASFRVGGHDPNPAPSPGVQIPHELPELEWRLIAARENIQPQRLWQEPELAAADRIQTETFADPDRVVDVTAKVAPAVTDTPSGVELSFQYRVIGLQRPWLRAHLCQLKGWAIPGLPAGRLSNGMAEGNPGILPVLTTRMLVVRNLAAKAHWSDTDRARAASAETLALGPFTLAGADRDGSVLTRQAPQVVAWLAAVLPACPPGEANDADTPAALGKVVSRGPLTVRSDHTTKAAMVGSLNAGQTVALACKVKGEPVDGNTVWYRLGQDPRGWAAARYIKNLGPVPPCPAP
ncbi:SH3 domain-containing protein [Streptomyces sp. t39]|nr:SH3 domain-containing protein [Streptomyces sp. t39]